MFPIFFHLGPLVLHTYGLMIALGFICAYQVARRQFYFYGLEVPGSDHRLEIAVWHIMIAALLGARIAYVVLNGWPEFLEDPWSFFRIWEGGLVFYGGAIGGFIGLLMASRRWPARPAGGPGTLLKMTDAFAAPLLLGQAFGRIGCFAAGCCFGRPTDRPWGVVFTNSQSLGPLYEKVHPTQLYESAGAFVLFALALWLSRRVRSTGWVTVFYCVSYGLLRFIIEFWRGDDRGSFHFNLSPSQWGSLLLIGIGVALVATMDKTGKNNAKP